MTYSHFFFFLICSIYGPYSLKILYVLSQVYWKTKGRVCMSTASTQISKKNHFERNFSFLFLPLFWQRCFGIISQSDLKASVVLLGNLVFNCIFLSDSSPSVHVNGKWRGLGITQTVIMSCMNRLHIFNCLKLEDQLQLTDLETRGKLAN